MSRVGKSPIQLPGGVNLAVADGTITVTGPKGTLSQVMLDDITVSQDNNIVSVKRANDEPKVRAKHGLVRALINNMVVGVTEGFSKQLEINGVGYRAALAGTDLRLNIGLSHDVNYKVPQGIVASIEGNVITISGIDRQLVGQVAAEIRAFKKPEPYKGKGIKYVGERIIRKSGKSGKDK